MARHPGGSLAEALSDSSCPATRLLAALIHSCGYFVVALEESGRSIQFFAGPTAGLAKLQLSLDHDSRQLSGELSALTGTVYSALQMIEHELDAAVYLPPEMRRDRVLSICGELGVDEDFFHMVLSNQGA